MVKSRLVEVYVNLFTCKDTGKKVRGVAIVDPQICCWACWQPKWRGKQSVNLFSGSGKDYLEHVYHQAGVWHLGFPQRKLANQKNRLKERDAGGRWHCSVWALGLALVEGTSSAELPAGGQVETAGRSAWCPVPPALQLHVWTSGLLRSVHWSLAKWEKYKDKSENNVSFYQIWIYLISKIMFFL